MIAIVIVVAGCTRSLVPGWEKPVAYFRPPSGLVWKIHVTNQWRVSWECQKEHWFVPIIPLFAYGCTTNKRELWVIDSWVASNHECAHIKKLDNGRGEFPEWAKDILYKWHIDNVAFLLTFPIPAREKPCGDGVDSDTKSRWIILPSVTSQP